MELIYCYFRLASVQEQRTSTDVTALQIDTDGSPRQQPDSIQLANKVRVECFCTLPLAKIHRKGNIPH